MPHNGQAPLLTIPDRGRRLPRGTTVRLVRSSDTVDIVQDANGNYAVEFYQRAKSGQPGYVTIQLRHTGT
jgi:hypothetical protein